MYRMSNEWLNTGNRPQFSRDRELTNDKDFVKFDHQLFITLKYLCGRFDNIYFHPQDFHKGSTEVINGPTNVTSVFVYKLHKE